MNYMQIFIIFLQWSAVLGFLCFWLVTCIFAGAALGAKGNSNAGKGKGMQMIPYFIIAMLPFLASLIYYYLSAVFLIINKNIIISIGFLLSLYMVIAFYKTAKGNSK